VRPRNRALACAFLGLILLAAVAGVWAVRAAGDVGPPAQVLWQNRPIGAVPLAVLGDSNSHSFQDGLVFRPGDGSRGGDFHARTLGWVDGLARLRGHELDPGPRLVWGSSGRISSARRALGLPVGRIPIKEDYLYNFANSGADCNSLTSGPFRQAPRLAALMDKEPERWRDGVVVIFIGVNDWMRTLDLQVRNPAAPELDAVIARCTRRIAEAMSMLRERQPALRFLVIGMGNVANDPGNSDKFRSALQMRNLRIALERFNASMRGLVDETLRTAFLDQEAWFHGLWGDRDANGQPRYKTVTIGDGFKVTNTTGDDPHNAMLVDGHAGTVANALLLQAIVGRLREAFDLPVTPVGDDELWRYLQPLVAPNGGVKGSGS